MLTAASGEIAIVIWRECIEGLLAIGLLHAWLSRGDHPGLGNGLRFLWAGAASGLAGSFALAVLITRFADRLDGDAETVLQLVLVSLAAVLILQMVVWMQREGQASRLRQALATSGTGLGGLFLIACLAVLREGAEAVVFTYGILSSQAGAGEAAALAGIAGGLGLGIASFLLIQSCAARFPTRLFFNVTRILLLGLAASLTMTALDRAIELGLLPTLTGPLWDTSAVLDDSGPAGGLLSMLAGYRARPELLPLMVYAAFWVVALRLSRAPAPPRSAS